MAEKSPKNSELVLYQAEDGRTRIEVRLQNETVWLTQKQMADLFQKDVRTINDHVQNLFEEGELQPDSVIRKYRITAADGKSYDTNHYNLDVIISVGYRVKSLRGTRFRIWATQRLREYIVKGFTMDDERLKQTGGGGYFEELLARIRDIRSSEKAKSRKLMTMRDWIAKLDGFLRLSERDILTHAGLVSHDDALSKAQREYDKFHVLEDAQPSPVEVDFEAAVKKVKELQAAPKEKKKPGKSGD
jgi:hypothetical protein